MISDDLLASVEPSERDFPTSAAYLGVACLVLALARPLTPYYVLNIGEENIELTGLIEMTNLIDPSTETKGLSLIYLPKYMDSTDSRLEGSDDDLDQSLMERGIKRLFRDFDPASIVYRVFDKTKYVQPLPLVRHSSTRPPICPSFRGLSRS